MGSAVAVIASLGKSPEERRRQRERQASAKERYYASADHLMAYGKKYYFRYLPSSAKLAQKLAEKCGQDELVREVMAELLRLCDDKENALTVARRMQSQGKNEREIGENLRRRRFDRATIQLAVEAIRGDRGSTWEPDTLARKVAQLRRKGQSQQQIVQKLSAGSADSPLIKQAILDFDTEQENNEDGDLIALRGLVEKLQRQGVAEDKIISRLQRRGFAYAQIRNLLQGFL